MTAAEQDPPDRYWPSHWPRHSPIHDTQACPRCQRENAWDETHLGCMCIDHRWLLRDLGTPAVPDWQWVCGKCRRIQGPSWDGAA